APDGSPGRRAGRRPRPSRSRARARAYASAELGYDVDLDRDPHLGVRTVDDLVLARDLDRFGEQELLAVDLDVVGALEGLGDVLVADRTVDAALTGAHADGQLGVLEHLGEAFSVGLALGELLGPLREARLQLGLVGLRGRER